jgi:bacterioferritin-associated ferredoxin
MYVCHCETVSDRTVEAVVASGATSVEEITQKCGAGGGCGSCHSVLSAMLEAASVDREIAREPAA